MLAALAAVFVFLTIEGVPGLAKPAEFYGDATTFAGYVAPLLFGTVLAAVIALVVAVPLSWGIALVVSHYAPKRVATPIAYVIDLLAAVPSVVFGLWGISVLAPRLSPVYQWLEENAGWIPFFAGPASMQERATPSTPFARAFSTSCFWAPTSGGFGPAHSALQPSSSAASLTPS